MSAASFLQTMSKEVDGKFLRRIHWALAEESDRLFVQKVAVAEMLDVHTVRALFEFGDWCFIRDDSFDPHTEVIKLKPYAKSIVKMGWLLEIFRLARHVKGTAFAWTPRRKLYRILEERLPQKLPDDQDMNNIACLKALVEISDVLELILEDRAIMGLKKEFKKGWKLSSDLREFIVSTTVRRPSCAVSEGAGKLRLV